MLGQSSEQVTRRYYADNRRQLIKRAPASAQSLAAFLRVYVCACGSACARGRLDEAGSHLALSVEAPYGGVARPRLSEVYPRTSTAF